MRGECDEGEGGGGRWWVKGGEGGLVRAPIIVDDELRGAIDRRVVGLRLAVAAGRGDLPVAQLLRTIARVELRRAERGRHACPRRDLVKLFFVRLDCFQTCRLDSLTVCVFGGRMNNAKGRQPRMGVSNVSMETTTRLLLPYHLGIRS